MNWSGKVVVIVAVAYNLYRIVSPTADPESKWGWAAGFAAGCAWCLVLRWYFDLPASLPGMSEAECYEDRVREERLFDAKDD